LPGDPAATGARSARARPRHLPPRRLSARVVVAPLLGAVPPGVLPPRRRQELRGRVPQPLRVDRSRARPGARAHPPDSPSGTEPRVLDVDSLALIDSRLNQGKVVAR